ncbi:MAG: hypothetical protein NC311_02040 [Muribaculaceae bacterium]|nr:hypothetical protein [Muribaculaceae bacterium]
MQKIIFIVCCVCIAIGDAYADCAPCPLSSGQTCSSVGCKMCSDGTCRTCCTTSGGSSGTTCSGTYTTDTSQTFSTTAGSGYIQKQVYSKSCTCAPLLD